MKNSKKTYLTLFLLVMVFVLPIIAGNVLYSYRSHVRFATLNYGTVVNPALDVSFLYAEMNNSQERKWRIILVSDDVSDSASEHMYYQLGQVKKALGKDTDRVQVLQMGGQYQQLNKVVTLFAEQGKSNFAVKNKIYLVDPLGNLFMYYPATTNPMNVLKDLKRVLEVSQIG